MCNLYSVNKGQAEIRAWFNAQRDRIGNLPPLPSIFPGAMAPVVRMAEGKRQLEMMRWGMPGPPQFGGQPVTNIRNTKSPHWRRWLAPENRCLAIATSFCEYADTKPRKTPTWFALSDERPLYAFAGFWTPWSGLQGPKASPVEGEHRLYAFLTCEPNAVVAPVHPRAMPAILGNEEEFDIWLRAPWKQASLLQRPLADDGLRVVAKGEKQDPPSDPSPLDLFSMPA